MCGTSPTEQTDIYLNSLISSFFFFGFVVEIRLCLQKCKVIVSFKFVFDVLAEAIINWAMMYGKNETVVNGI